MFVLGLQRTHGNQAAQQYLKLARAADEASAAAGPGTLQRDDTGAAILQRDDVGVAILQRDDTATAEPAAAPKAPKKPAKKFLDQAAAQDA